MYKQIQNQIHIKIIIIIHSSEAYRYTGFSHKMFINHWQHQCTQPVHELP